jgi:16S rRNA C967 or C1407 C5-methylase (RsmB/RsmF family)/NOL1/NOP2/fmu family ribosome biogenesis protein
LTLDWSFPPDFAARMTALLGDESDAFLSALAAPEAGLRVNTLRIHPTRFEEISPFSLTPLPFPEGGYRVAEGERPGKHPYHAAGLYYLQDPGAMAVAAAAPPRPGERVLDLAAAPGGKATHLGALLGGEGILVANDLHPLRARELAGNLERMGVRNAIVTCESVARLAHRLGAWFDRVLLDAPCSGESMFSKSRAAREEWSDAAVLGCARRQGELLREAAGLVRPGGVLVYSTCTFSPAENEGALAELLRERPDFAIEPLDPIPGASPGRPDWLPGAPEGVEGAVRLWPHRYPGGGHFIACLRRGEGEEGSPAPSALPRPSAEARALLADFVSQRLHGGGPDLSRVRALGDELFELPKDAPDLAGLRVVRPGWWLGTLLKKRFEPAHALALGLTAGDGIDPVVLSPDDAATRAYLRGETVSAPGSPGWTLVTVDGYSLGWGKRVGSTVKNHYPRGLRWH